MNLIGVDIKNRFSILERLEDESQIVSQREDGANDIVLVNLQVKDFGMELSSRRKLGTRKRVVVCYPGAGIDFIKDRLEVVHCFRDVILYVRNKEGEFERSEILFKKLLIRAREMGRKVYYLGLVKMRNGVRGPWL